MSRFVRNLLVAQVGIFLVSEYAMLYRGVPLSSWLGIYPEIHRFAFGWQWITHVLVEAAGDAGLLDFLIAIFIGYSLYPYFERAHGRAAMVSCMAVTAVGSGVLATLTALALPPPIPASGAMSVIQGLLAYELHSRRGETLHFKLLPQSTSIHAFSAREVAAILLVFVLIRFAMMRVAAAFVLDLGSLLVGLGYGVFVERRNRLRPRRSLRVVKGGSRDRMLH